MVLQVFQQIDADGAVLVQIELDHIENNACKDRGIHNGFEVGEVNFAFFRFLEEILDDFGIFQNISDIPHLFWCVQKQLIVNSIERLSYREFLDIIEQRLL